MHSGKYMCLDYCVQTQREGERKCSVWLGCHSWVWTIKGPSEYYNTMRFRSEVIVFTAQDASRAVLCVAYVLDWYWLGN